MQTKNSVYQLTATEALDALQSSASGLSNAEHHRRLIQSGPNVLPKENGLSGMAIFASQFKNSLIVILVAALLISIVARELSDALIIGIAVITNVIFGFIQEFKAQKAFTALKRIITYTSLVKRENTVKTIPSKDVVPGDVIILRAGDRVPADARVISLRDLEVNESALTGESEPIVKTSRVIAHNAPVADWQNCVFAGTTVTDGNAIALVYATGNKTELGKIASALSKTRDDDTPLQKKLLAFSRTLGFFILAIAFLVLATGIWAGKPFKEMFLTSVAVAVAALPEGIAVTVTVILAVGMQRILRKKALVRKLVAAETLGGVTVMCIDKTGTITEGEMELDALATFGEKVNQFGSQVKEKSRNIIKALEVGVLCNDAYEEKEETLQKIVMHGTPTDRALYRAAHQAGIDRNQLNKKYKRIDAVPFTSEKKFMATLHEITAENKQELFIKGAPEIILPFITHVFKNGATVLLAPDDHLWIKNATASLTKRGFRVLVGAFKEAKNIDEIADLCFVGLYGLRDPIRKGVKETIALTKRAGITTLMLTGDHKFTAEAIAREVGIIEKDEIALDGEALDAMSPDAIQNALKTARVFARVSPEHKLLLVRALKENGEIVAMTGDGVNDAPALLRADIGIALGSGTDVAKGVADIVLLKDDVSVIVHAIEEGRVIFDNIRKVILFLLSDSFSEIIVIVFSLLWKLPLSLTVAQILWINIITDGVTSLALTVEPKERNIMDEKPKNSAESLLTQQTIVLIAAISCIAGLTASLYFYWFYRTVDLSMARTVVFVTLAVDSLLYIFSVRSLSTPLFRQKLFSNLWLVGAVVSSFALQLGAMYISPIASFLELRHLGVFEWLFVITEAIAVITVIEVVKFFYNKKTNALHIAPSH